MCRRLAVAWILLLVCCLFCSTSVWADRVIVSPSGSTLPPLAASVEGILAVSGSAANDTWINGSLKAVEFEGAQLEKPGRQASAVSVQLSILPETYLTPSISAGVRDVFDTARQFSNVGYPGRSLYLAAGKTLLQTQMASFPFRNTVVTAGLGTNTTAGFFGSASADVVRGIRQTLEFDGRGLNYRLSHNFGTVARLEYERLHASNFVGLEIHTPVHL